MIVQFVCPLRIDGHSLFHLMASISGLKFSTFSNFPSTDSISKCYKEYSAH